MFIPVTSSVPRRKPYVTVLLIISNVVVFILMHVKPSLFLNAFDIYDAQGKLAFTPVSLIRGYRLWTIVSSMFVHANVLHLAGNMIYLFFFGSAVESAMGGKRFLIFYLMCGLSAALFHVLSIALIPTDYLLSQSILNPWVTPVVGASGAVSGVMGAYLVYYPRSRMTVAYPIIFIPLFFTMSSWVYVLSWFILQVIFGLMVLTGYAVSSIAYWAHVGGFVMGIALAPVMLSEESKGRIKYMGIIEEMLKAHSSLYIEEDFG